MRKVSVIIPVYKVSGFVRKCAESLMNQTLDDVEFIFVDDCSPDDSVDIIEEVLKLYPSRDVVILHHEKNKGLPSARNTGLEYATGEYVFHCDGDDWVEVDMLEKMYNTAVEHHADLVYSDFFLTFDARERYMSNPSFSCARDLLCEGLLAGTTKYNVWNKLVKKTIYTENHITFPDGHSMGEDMTMIMVVACSSKVAHVPEALYHYVKTNVNAYSNNVSERQLKDIRFNVDKIMSFFENYNDNTVKPYLNYFKLGIKLPFLMSNKVESYLKWQNWYPESNKYVMSNKRQPIRIRLLQWCAAHNLFFVLRLYHIFVYRLVYGVVYR